MKYFITNKLTPLSVYTVQSNFLQAPPLKTFYTVVLQSQFCMSSIWHSTHILGSYKAQSRIKKNRQTYKYQTHIQK